MRLLFLVGNISCNVARCKLYCIADILIASDEAISNAQNKFTAIIILIGAMPDTFFQLLAIDATAAMLHVAEFRAL